MSLSICPVSSRIRSTGCPTDRQIGLKAILLAAPVTGAVVAGAGNDGISARDFDSLLSLWLDRLTEFQDFIDW